MTPRISCIHRKSRNPRSARAALATVAALALAWSVIAPVPARAAAGRHDPAPTIESVLPDRPKPIADIRNTLPKPGDADSHQNPLDELSKDMTVVVGDLNRQQTGHPVQAEEDQILQTMDVLIKQLEKQCNCNCQKPGSKSCSNPSKPLQDSMLVGGPGGIGPLRPVDNSHKSWGQLPPRQRDQILQSRTEGFPAGFENILQSYYFRLSTEQVNREGNAGAPAAPADSGSNTPH
jgi:hypothetical protein